MIMKIGIQITSNIYTTKTKNRHKESYDDENADEDNDNDDDADNNDGLQVSPVENRSSSSTCKSAK